MGDKKLIDLYELTMAYSDFKNGRHEDIVYFDAYFRKNIEFFLSSYIYLYTNINI